MNRKGIDEVIFDVINFDLPSVNSNANSIFYKGLPLQEGSNTVLTDTFAIEVIHDNYFFNYKYFYNMFKERINTEKGLSNDRGLILFFEPDDVKLKVNTEIIIPNLVVESMSNIKGDYINNKLVTFFTVSFKCGLIDII